MTIAGMIICTVFLIAVWCVRFHDEADHKENENQCC